MNIKKTVKSAILKTRPVSSLNRSISYTNHDLLSTVNLTKCVEELDDIQGLNSKLELCHLKSVTEEKNLQVLQKLTDLEYSMVEKVKEVKKNELQKSLVQNSKLKFLEKDSIKSSVANQRLKEKIKMTEDMNRNKKQFVDVRKVQLKKLSLDHKYKHLLTQQSKKKNESDQQTCQIASIIQKKNQHKEIANNRQTNEKIIDKHKDKEEEKRKKLVLSFKVDRELAILKNTNLDKIKQIKVRNRIKEDIKKENTRVNNYRQQISEHIGKRGFYEERMSEIKHRQSKLKNNYLKIQNNVHQSAYDLDKEFEKLSIKPTDYKTMSINITSSKVIKSGNCDGAYLSRSFSDTKIANKLNLNLIQRHGIGVNDLYKNSKRRKKASITEPNEED